MCTGGRELGAHRSSNICTISLELQSPEIRNRSRFLQNHPQLRQYIKYANDNSHFRADLGQSWPRPDLFALLRPSGTRRRIEPNRKSVLNLHIFMSTSRTFLPLSLTMYA
jgi:hypothetical protein